MGKGPGGRDRKEAAQAPPAPAIEINSAADFPPLPPHSVGDGAVKSQGTHNNLIPTKKYTIDDIIQIVSHMSEAPLPPSIKLVMISN